MPFGEMLVGQKLYSWTNAIRTDVILDKCSEKYVILDKCFWTKLHLDNFHWVNVIGKFRVGTYYFGKMLLWEVVIMGRCYYGKIYLENGKM